MYDGPMSLTGSCWIADFVEMCSRGIQFGLAAHPERDVVQAGAILVEAVRGDRPQPEQRAAEVVDDAAVQEARTGRRVASSAFSGTSSNTGQPNTLS